MRRCRSRPQQIWYNVLGLYGSPLVFRVSNTKRHSQNCISERVGDPNSALNGFSPGKRLLFRLLAHCSHTLTVKSVCILVFWGIPLAIVLATALSNFGEPYTRATDVPLTQASRLAAQAADVGMVGNGRFVLTGALGEHTETGPATSASTSTFSTVASISGRSLSVSKSLSTRKSAVCCVDSVKLAVRSQLASHSFSHPNSMGCDSLHWQNSQSVPVHLWYTDHPASYLLAPGQPAIFWLPLHFLRHLDRASWPTAFPQVLQTA